MAVQPGPAPPGPDGARRVALAHLVGRAVATVGALARHYAAASEQAPEGLREALMALARGQEQLAGELGPVAQALGVAVSPPVSAPPPSPRWGVVLREAFEAERRLESLGRELGALAEAPALRALGARLAQAAARDRDAVRGLYLRYC